MTLVPMCALVLSSLWCHHMWTVFNHHCSYDTQLFYHSSPPWASRCHNIPDSGSHSSASSLYLCLPPSCSMNGITQYITFGGWSFSSAAFPWDPSTLLWYQELATLTPKGYPRHGCPIVCVFIQGLKDNWVVSGLRLLRIKCARLFRESELSFPCELPSSCWVGRLQVSFYKTNATSFLGVVVPLCIQNQWMCNPGTLHFCQHWPLQYF